MASLTKMMTLYVCYQLSTTYNLNAESEEIIVPRIAAYTCGTSAFLRENEKLSLQDLYYALMLPSGNDAAVTLAHHFGQLLIKNPLQPIKIRQQLNSSQINQIQSQQQYSQKQNSPERDISPYKKYGKEDAKQLNENQNPDQQQNLSQYQQLDQKKKSQQFISRFVKEMNKYAQKLGMRDSQFSNCHGLASKSNRSTCEDLSKVALNIIQTPYLQQICSTKNYQCIIYHTIKQDIRKAEWVNTNKLLWDETNSFKGVKTGCTDNAGPCLCVYYKDPANVNIELIVTVLCCKNPERRFDDSSNLARWAARQLKSSQVPIQQSTSNQNKFQFYNPSNSNQKNLFSRSNAFQAKNKNEISSERIISQLEQVQSSDKVYQLGRTINSFTQLTSFCNINTSFIQANNSNTINLNNSNIKASKNTQKVTKIISPLLQQSEQNRINKFINSNINQISNHHFNVNSLYGKDESDLTERSIIPSLTNRGNSNIQNQNNNQIQRDHSAKLLYNSAEKNTSINLIKKRIEDKTKIENQTKYSKSPTKIQKIISQLNSCKPNTIQNVPQLAISSSQSTSYSSNQTSSTNKNYNDNILSIQNDSIGSDNNNNPNTILSPTTTRSIQISHQTSEIQNQNFNISNNPSIIQNCEEIQQADQSQQNTLLQNQNSKQDSHTSQLNILLNERIQYRSEIRDSIKKPIGGGNNINQMQTISQNPNSERSSSLINQSLINNLEINKSINLNNSNTANNNNHNIKIFSKSKKKRYIISCLANIN
ncbi:hypothetical protein ABPG74_022764 [Tetrahymena malaccensis]